MAADDLTDEDLAEVEANWATEIGERLKGIVDGTEVGVPTPRSSGVSACHWATSDGARVMHESDARSPGNGVQRRHRVNRLEPSHPI